MVPDYTSCLPSHTTTCYVICKFQEVTPPTDPSTKKYLLREHSLLHCAQSNSSRFFKLPLYFKLEDPQLPFNIYKI